MKYLSELSIPERTAFARFLLMEKRRHESDIAALEEDLKRIVASGIDISQIEPWDWVSTEEKR